MTNRCQQSFFRLMTGLKYINQKNGEFMMKFCYSCGAPLDAPDFKGQVENFCKYCTDENGTLKPREEIKSGIMQFLQSWQPDVSAQEAENRAEHYMLAMPAWA